MNIFSSRIHLLITLILMGTVPHRAWAVPLPPMPQNAQQGAQPGAPKLSEDDVKMLQEVEQEINKFVSSLPQEEQKKFWSDVDELTKVMSTMNEEELVKFMDNVLQEQEKQPTPAAPMPMPVTPPAPMPPPIFTKPQETIPSSVEPTDSHERLYKLIESVALLTNNFLTKAQEIPDMSGKFESWIKEGKLRGIKAGTNWNSFRVGIETFVAKLNKVKERDAITGKFKYLDELIKDENLINNLQRTKDVLNRAVPKIAISPFGIEKMDHETRAAMRIVISALTEATTTLAIPAALDKAIEKFEPLAKQLREKEEAAQKQAFDASRRMQWTTPATVAGRPEERGDAGARDYSKFDFGSIYKPAPIPTAGGGTEKEKSKFADDKKDGAGKDKGSTGAAGGEKKDEKKSEEKALEAEDKQAAGLYDAFWKSISNLSGIIEDNMDAVRGYSDKQDEEVTKELNQALTEVRSALSNVRQLKRRTTQIEKAKPAAKKMFKKAVQDTLKENNDILGRLPTPNTAKGVYAEIVDNISAKLVDIKKVAEQFDKKS